MDKARINSSDSMCDSINQQDNYPQVYSSSNGNLHESGKKEQDIVSDKTSDANNKQDSEHGDIERSNTEINVDQSIKNKQLLKNIQQSSNSEINFHKNAAVTESYNDSSNFQVNHNHPKRNPDFGGGSEPLVSRNVSGFLNQRQIASQHNVGNRQRNHRASSHCERYSHESNKIESDQDNQENTSSNQSCENSIAQSPFAFLQKGQFKELQEMMKTNNLMYTQITNEQGNNMIIKAVQTKDIEAIKQLLKDARHQLYEKGLRKEQVEYEIAAWINKESKTGYTAAHFGCYVGNPEMLLLLKEQGADYFKLNNEGSTGLHVAAQNDSISSIIFLLLLGFNINVTDLKNATPLHWASFQGLDQSVLYLNAFGANPNMQDSEGMTPLILSAISGSMKIIRTLLLAGADRDQKDIKDRTALYMVTEDPENINEDIAEMLKRTNGFQEYWNIRPVFKPSKKNLKQVSYYLLMYFFSQLCLIYFNYTLWDDLEKSSILFVICTFVLITKFFFFNSWLRNPGYVSLNKKSTDIQQEKMFKDLEKMSDEAYEKKYSLNQEAQRVYSKEPLDQKTKRKLIELFILLSKEDDPAQVCAQCSILKPKRSRHCDICKQCVSVYDHHCPWINNCVGTRNHAYFLGFIIFIWINIFICSVINVLYIWQGDYPRQSSSDLSPIYIDPFNIFTSDDELLFFILKIVFSAISLFFGLLFGLPLTFLIIVQIGNFRQNKTTYERFSQKAKQQHTNSQIQNESNQFSNLHPDESQLTQSFLNQTSSNNSPSSFQNCLSMCFLNKKNKNYLYRKIDEEQQLKQA